MRSILLTALLLAILDSLLATTCFSQPDSVSQNPTRVILKDGSELIGTIVREDSLRLDFKTIGDISMTIPREQVKTLERLSGQIADGTYVRTDPNQTRLLFGPTARSLKQGQGYFSAYEIFFPMIGIGVTDFLTLAGGMSLFPGASGQLFYLAPKITPIQVSDFSVAGGALYINATEGGSDGVGIVYGVSTYGGQNASLTFGLGWGFYGSDIADNPVIMVGGELRVSNSVKIISENWIPPNSDIVFVSFGFRFFGDNLAADLGFIHPAGSRITGFPFIPWLGFAYNFGTSK